MHTFEENSLVVTYIKELLHNFNLPMLDVYTDESKLYENKVYIKGTKIVKYLSDGFKTLDNYEYNRPMLNRTTNLTINSSNYDTATHRYLGNYLRFIRDYHGLDLMGMYNCFEYTEPSKLVRSIKISDTHTLQLNSLESNYTYYMVPVKFNKTYTIAIDSPVPYEMMCVVYTNNFMDDTTKSTDLDNLVKDTYKSIKGSNYKHPFLYSTVTDLAANLWDKEKHLYLLLKLPNIIDSSITILEGTFDKFVTVDNVLVSDFKLGAYVVADNDMYIWGHKLTNRVPMRTKEEQDSKATVVKNEHYGVYNNYPTRLSLLEVNDKKSYPFADRLVEYLVGSAVTELDTIPNNILRVQYALYGDSKFNGYYGIWTQDTTRDVFDKIDNWDKTKGNIQKTNRLVSTNGNLMSEYRKVRQFKDNYKDLTYRLDKDIEARLRLED